MQQIPLLGFGTMSDDADFGDCITMALETGYRHFDTAEEYKNKAAFKEAITASDVPRAELFITSKLKGMPSGDYNSVKLRTEELLADLGVKYVDLLLIHWPGSPDFDFLQPPEQEMKKATFKEFKSSIKTAWSNMIQLKRDGLTREIGVSNFYKQHIEELLSIVSSDEDKPYANEIYVDLVHPEEEFVCLLQKNNIRVISYRSISFISVYSFLEDVTESLNEIMKSVDDKQKMTLPQFILAWLMKRGIHVIPKSTNKDRIKENYEAAKYIENITETVQNALKNFDSHEMICMYGGEDEYASQFKSVMI